MRLVVLRQLWYETRVLGVGSWCALALVVVVGALGVILVLALHVPGASVTWLGAQLLAALATGLCVAANGSYDAARELLLTLPAPYRQVMWWRCALLGIWTGTLTLAANIIFLSAGITLFVTPYSGLAQLWVASQLQGATLLICFGSVGLCTALLLQSSMGGATILAGMWMGLLFLALDATLSWQGWLAFYSGLLLVSIIAMALNRYQLSNADRLLRGISGE